MISSVNVHPTNITNVAKSFLKFSSCFKIKFKKTSKIQNYTLDICHSSPILMF